MKKWVFAKKQIIDRETSQCKGFYPESFLGSRSSLRCCRILERVVWWGAERGCWHTGSCGEFGNLGIPPFLGGKSFCSARGHSGAGGGGFVTLCRGREGSKGTFSLFPRGNIPGSSSRCPGAGGMRGEHGQRSGASLHSLCSCFSPAGFAQGTHNPGVSLCGPPGAVREDSVGPTALGKAKSRIFCCSCAFRSLVSLPQPLCLQTVSILCRASKK